MRKLTVLHYTQIVYAMRNSIVKYTNAYLAKEADDTMLQMYAEDISNANELLAQFVATRDAAQLHNAIVSFDTAVREEFVDVLLYIERNRLVAEDECVCI